MKSTPSTIGLTISGSERNSAGVMSINMKSYFWRSSSNSCGMRSDISSSDGLGGIGPQGMTSRQSSTCWTASSTVLSPVKTETNPTPLRRLKMRDCTGLCISASIRSTFLPARAVSSDTNAIEELLPSCGILLVNMKILPPGVLERDEIKYCRLVRSRR